MVSLRSSDSNRLLSRHLLAPLRQPRRKKSSEAGSLGDYLPALTVREIRNDLTVSITVTIDVAMFASYDPQADPRSCPVQRDTAARLRVYDLSDKWAALT